MKTKRRRSLVSSSAFITLSRCLKLAPEDAVSAVSFSLPTNGREGIIKVKFANGGFFPWTGVVMAEQQVLEGTWEEIVRHADELAGYRLRVLILDAQAESSNDDDDVNPHAL